MYFNFVCDRFLDSVWIRLLFQVLPRPLQPQLPEPRQVWCVVQTVALTLLASLLLQTLVATPSQFSSCSQSNTTGSSIIACRDEHSYLTHANKKVYYYCIHVHVLLSTDGRRVSGNNEDPTDFTQGPWKNMLQDLDMDGTDIHSTLNSST